MIAYAGMVDTYQFLRHVPKLGLFAWGRNGWTCPHLLESLQILLLSICDEDSASFWSSFASLVECPECRQCHICFERQYTAAFLSPSSKWWQLQTWHCIWVIEGPLAPSAIHNHGNGWYPFMIVTIFLCKPFFFLPCCNHGFLELKSLLHLYATFCLCEAFLSYRDPSKTLIASLS